MPHVEVGQGPLALLRCPQAHPPRQAALATSRVCSGPLHELTAAHCTNLQRPIARRLALPSTTYYYYYCRVSALLTHPQRERAGAGRERARAAAESSLCVKI